MTSTTLTDAHRDLAAPVASSERIQALDVVRGFALIGIFLMNVEFFNRPLSELGMGLPATATGLDWWAGWFIYSFVQGKFWTMFSLLFGMGFAVMLTRAERAERNFIRPYLRRIAALAAFGALHHIFIWGGDILFSYAVAAVGLLLLMYGNGIAIAVAFVVLLGLGFAPGMDPLFQVAGGLAFVAIGALFLRGEKRVNVAGRSVLLFSLVFLVIGALLALFAIALWTVPGLPEDPRIPMTIMAAITLLIGWSSNRYHDPIDARTRRLGVGMYLFPFVMMTCFGIAQVLNPPTPPPPPAPVASAASSAPGAAASKAATARTDGKAAGKAKKSEAELYAERKAESDKNRREHEAEIANERRIEMSGSYMENVRLRAKDFAENAPGEAGFAVILIGMFLLGTWFVRSGVMENTAAHLPLFRKLALTCLPLGLGLGLGAQLLGTARTPGLDVDPYQIAMGLTMIGNLPACLGYVSVVVLMLHSGGVFSRIRVLAPLGRMALTNYLTHSILGTLFFYGFGLGNWGMGRALQVVFVFVIIAIQVMVCHWWLGRFRYGPMEWLWRAITYWQVPAMRRENAAVGASRVSA
jgi:uncharacterized membrane protein YeiB